MSTDITAVAEAAPVPAKQIDAYLREVLSKSGSDLHFVAGDPPVHARVCADPTHSAPTVHIRFEPLPSGVSANPSVYLWLHVGAGLDRLFQTYRNRGVKVVREPEDKPWGLRQFIIEDCNGYLLSYAAELSAA